MCSLTEDERNLWTSICQVFWKKFQKFIRNLINWSFLISKPSVYEIQNHQPIPYNIHTRSDLNSRPCIWEKRNNRIKDPEPLKFCRRFERFAANLVDCLSVKDYWFQYLRTRVIEGKFANQRPFKTTSKISGLDPLCYYFVFLIYNCTTYSNYNLLLSPKIFVIINLFCNNNIFTTKGFTHIWNVISD